MILITFEGGHIMVVTQHLVEKMLMRDLDKMVRLMLDMPEDSVDEIVHSIDNQIITSAASGAIGPERMMQLVNRLKRLGYHEGWTIQDCRIMCRKLRSINKEENKND